ncbi:MAG: hypothetical protein C5B51_22675 [Terriglobia bacterium]|nr:MAG: hypothetical protein C5B51_22675 [Terriglobia bacterium]
MDSFLRDAEQILETAVQAKDSGTPEYLISVSYRGTIDILAETAGWSLAGFAAERGSRAVYRVSHRSGGVRVEGWSAGRECVLSRRQPLPEWMRVPRAALYATLQPVELTGGSAKDLSPHVWNS